MKDDVSTFPYAQTSGEMEAWVRRFKRELQQREKQQLKQKTFWTANEPSITIDEVLGGSYDK